MADKRISQLIERTDIANNDVLPIVASAAITTNKVTVSTLQDWMQDNLDLGVTSVGITLGTSGTDVNVTGSPITSSGNITINIPTASATNRGLLSSADWNTFTNDRVPYTGATDDVDLGFNNLDAGLIKINGSSAGFGGNLGFRHSNSAATGGEGYTSISTSGTSTIRFRSVSGGIIRSFEFNMGLLNTIGNSRQYSLPDANGTLALTSDLGGYVTLGTDQTITAQKTFTNSGSDSNIIVNHTSGSGIALDITKAGNGEGLRVNKTGGNGNAVTITGGLLSAEAATLTGALNGTSAFFNSTMRIGTINNGAGDFITTDANGVLTKRTAAETLSDIGGVGIEGTLSPFIIPITNSNGTKLIDTNIGIANATNTIVGINGLAIDSRNTQPLVFRTNDSEKMRITSTGNVGIGTTAPSANLHVKGSAGSAIIRIEDSAGVSVGRIQANAGDGSINFFEQSGYALTFGTSNTERMRITSTGNVGIGTTAPDLENGGGQVIYNSSVPRLAFRNSTSGSTAFDGTDLALVSSDFYVFNRESGAIILGTGGTERARVTSNGITFNGDTAAANALDDYEEGTWTPAITIDGASAGLTYGGQIGRYTKIGNIVLVSGTISLSNKGSSTGSVRIVGLPFSRSNISGLFSCLAVNAFSLDTTRQVVAQVNYADAGEPIELKIGGTDTNLTHSELTNSTGIRFQFSYQTT